jgi:hypothetical protein
VFALVLGVLVAAVCGTGEAFERLVQAHVRDTVDDAALLEDLGAVFADGITGALVVSGTAFTGSLVGTVWKTTSRPLVELPLNLKHSRFERLSDSGHRSKFTAIPLVRVARVPSVEQTVEFQDDWRFGLLLSVRTDGWLWLFVPESLVMGFNDSITGQRTEDIWAGNHVHIDMRWPIRFEGERLRKDGTVMAKLTNDDDYLHETQLPKTFLTLPKPLQEDFCEFYSWLGVCKQKRQAKAKQQVEQTEDAEEEEAKEEEVDDVEEEEEEEEEEADGKEEDEDGEEEEDQDEDDDDEEQSEAVENDESEEESEEDEHEEQDELPEKEDSEEKDDSEEQDESEKDDSEEQDESEEMDEEEEAQQRDEL